MRCIQWLRNLTEFAAELLGFADDASLSSPVSIRCPPLLSFADAVLEDRNMPGETLMGILATSWALPQRSDALFASVADQGSEVGGQSSNIEGLKSELGNQLELDSELFVGRGIESSSDFWNRDSLSGGEAGSGEHNRGNTGGEFDPLRASLWDAETDLAANGWQTLSPGNLSPADGGVATLSGGQTGGLASDFASAAAKALFSNATDSAGSGYSGGIQNAGVGNLPSVAASSALPGSSAPGLPISLPPSFSNPGSPLTPATGTPGSPRGPPLPMGTNPNAQITQNYGQMPLIFEKNVGQTDPSVQFLAHGPGYTLFLTGTEAVMSLQESGVGNQGSGSSSQLGAGLPTPPFGPTGGLSGLPTDPTATTTGANTPSSSPEVLRMQLVGSNPAAQAVGLDQVETRTNYFIGNDPTKWHTDIPNYAQVIFQNVYPGIDLIYHAGPSSPLTTNNSPLTNLEYDFLVHPGVDTNQIQWTMQGAKDMHLDDQRNLVITTPSGQQLTEHAPVVFQKSEVGSQGAGGGGASTAGGQQVSGHYVLDDSGHVGFQVAAYDHSRTLVIDPMLGYSTYLGGSASPWGGAGARGIAVDSSGCAYVAGWTYSLDFPILNAFQQTIGSTYYYPDAFVSKLNPAGNALVYSTYLGGSGNDFANGIAVDSSGDAYVTGVTVSTNFPVQNPFQVYVQWLPDAFVTKLSAAGNALVYSTYLGASGAPWYAAGWTLGQAIAVDSSGSAYITGYTYSSAFPVQNPFQATKRGSLGPNAFVSKLNSSGNGLVYSTYLGGSGFSYIVTISFLYSYTVFQGDYGEGIAVDSAGDAYVTGYTWSGDFPIANALQPTNRAYSRAYNAFVTELNPAGNGLVYSTYLGGSGWGSSAPAAGDAADSIALDSAGDAYVTGTTWSSDFPVQNPILATKLGLVSIFVSKIIAGGSGLVYSTYLGSTYGMAIAVDSAGNAYISGWGNGLLQNPFQTTGTGFVSELNTVGSRLVYSSPLAGTGDVANGIAVDGAGNAYLAGVAYSNDLPIQDAFQTNNRSYPNGSNAFIAKVVPGPFTLPQFNDPGDVMTTNTGTRGGDPQSSAFSEGGVRFFDGAIDLNATDLSAGGFGIPWGQTRSWTNTTSYPAVSQNGSGMIDTQLPYLFLMTYTANANTIAAISTGTNARYFDWVNNNYQEKFFMGDTLTHDGNAHDYTLTDTAGDQIHFYDFSSNWPTLQQGQFKSFVDPYGNVTQVTSHAANGTVTEVQRSTVSNGNTYTESYAYSYIQNGVNAGLLSNVTLRRSVNGGQWSTVRQVAYTYFDGTIAGGNQGDLEFAQVEDANGSLLDTTYYRYYTTGDSSGVGYPHALKYVLYPQSYARLTAALGTNVSALSDSQVAPYANYFFQFDAFLHVTREDMPTGNGIGRYTFTYTKSNNATDFNAWAVQTVETLPDNNTETVFTNGYGEVMLKDFFSVLTGQHWYTYTRYDVQGRMLWTADPAAVTGYNTSYADLINYNGSTSPYLSNTQGEIAINDYYTSTTAGESTAGSVTGYLQDTKIQFTQSGTPVPQNTLTYFLHTANGVSVAPVATSTVYRNTNGSGGEASSYSYSWFAGTVQMEAQTVTKPVVPSAENGPGVADQETTYYDTFGRTASSVDGDGFVNNATYDPATGAVNQTITDVNGLHLTTQIQVDALGRPTQVTEPNGNVTVTVYKDTNYETRIYPGWSSTTLTTTGPTQDMREDRVNSYVETLTMSVTPHTTNGVPDGTEAITSMQTLSRSYVNQYGAVNRKDDYYNLTNPVVNWSAAPYIGTAGTNYYSTLYTYDSRGRLYQIQLPTGTLEQTLFDALGRKTSDWIGTSTANLVDVTDYQYDGGGVGDSNLTKVIQHPAGISIVTSISPTAGPIAGGTSVIINGTNLKTATGVSFGSVAASFSVISDNQIVAISPPVANPVTVDVTVTTSAGTSPTSSADSFTYMGVPTVTGISPTAGPLGGGTSVIITGTNLTGAYSVSLGGTAATSFTVNSSTQITASSPSHAAGTVDITVTTLGGTSATGSADQFTYTAAPTVTSISPTSGPPAGGTSVTINGTNFTGVTAVKFGTTPATSFTVNTSIKITATSPSHSAGTVDITVTTAGGTSATGLADQFTYTAGPSVTSISPTTGPTAGGTIVIINGTNFTGATAVKFGTTNATSFTVNSSIKITATSPSHTAGTVDITVTTLNGTSSTSSADQFIYTSVPVVYGISPTSGPTAGNTSVTITGINFAGVTAVKFGTNNAISFHVNFSTSITATSPAGSAGTVDITVTTSGGTSGTSSADQFAYVAPPTVTGVSPNSGSTGGGTSVTITGTNLSNATTVTFGSTAATSFTVNSSTQITATSPAEGAAMVDVTVTTAGGTSATGSADKFTYNNSPSVSSISPTSGPTAGGTSITITGTNFTGATAVTFGATAATSLTVNSSTQITATSPAENPVTVDITVTNSSGTSSIATADQYTFVPPPIVMSVSPIVGGIAGGTTVTVLGTAFTGATSVMFGGTAASSFTVNSDSQITAISPAEAAGIVDITVTTVGGTSATTPNDQFTFVTVPTVTSVSPTAGPTTGGATVTINGANFTGATAVYFGPNSATSFTVNTDAKITATSPPGYGSIVDITVTASGLTSAKSSADQYTYYTNPQVAGVSPWWGYVTGGTTVTISGYFFTGATAVSFGGTAATSFTVNNDNEITATAPHGGGWVDVTVTSPGGTSGTWSADEFWYQGTGTALITLVSPAGGTSSGGTTVTITGVTLSGATAVKFGTASASFTINSSTKITATAPFHAAGPVDISVVTAHNGTTPAVPADRYYYTPNNGNGPIRPLGPSGSGSSDRVTQYFYDWRNREVAEKDGVQTTEDTSTHRPILYYSLDNLSEAVTTQHYDGDTVTLTTTNGVPQPPSASLLRAQLVTSFDEQGRAYRTQTYSVDQTTGAVSSTALTANLYFDHRGDLIEDAEPGSPVTKTTYDGAGRATMQYVTDGAGGTSWAAASSVASDHVLSQEETIYDGDDNPIETIDWEVFHNETAVGALVGPNTSPKARESYATEYFDAADREIASVDVGTNGGAAYTRPATPPLGSNITLVTDSLYNSAGWRSDTIDPSGIYTHENYDNLGRTTQTIDAYTNGVPTANTNQITNYTYDGDNNTLTVSAVNYGPSGQTTQTTQYLYGTTVFDGNGNYTGNDLFSNDLLLAVEHPDPTTGNPSTALEDKYTLDALGEGKTSTDRNGSVHTYSYDVLGRETADAVTTLAPNVNGTIQRLEIAYDTGDRPYLFTSFDASSGGNVINQVQDVFDGLGQLTTEYQSHSGAVNTGTSPKVQYAYTQMAGGVNNSRLTQITYPTTSRVLDFNYSTGVNDAISRVSSLTDGTNTLESYSYLGLDTVAQESRPQTGVNLTYIIAGGNPDGGDQYTGLDRFGRVDQQLWTNGSTNTTDNFTYGYDTDSNALYRNDLVNASFGELYHASGAGNGYDLLNRLTGFARGTLSASQQGGGVLDTVSSPTRTQGWTPDAQGNFTTVTTNGTPINGTANAQNELTSVGASTLAYNNDGDTTTDQAGNTLIYDAWNRLIQIKNGSTVLATYSYDAEGRRVLETDGSNPTRDIYFNSGWQVVEEDVSGSVKDQYVWGLNGSDELVMRDASGSGLGVQYVQEDANSDVTAITDTSGNVLERYVYDAYGQPTFLTANWSTESGSAYAWNYLFQAGRLDAITDDYNFRNRDYSPTLYRWLESDPIGFAGGQTNLYAGEGDNPTNGSDPTGLDDQATQYRYMRQIGRPTCMICHGRMDLSGSVDFSSMSPSELMWVGRWLNAEGTDLNELQRKSDRITAFGPTEFSIGVGQGAGHLATHPWELVTVPAKSGYNFVFDQGQLKEDFSDMGKALVLQPARTGGNMAGNAIVAAPLTWAGFRLFGTGLGKLQGAATFERAIAETGGKLPPASNFEGTASLSARRMAIQEALENGEINITSAQRAGVARSPQHHIFPQEERAWFLERGIDVDQYTVTLDQGTHEALHYGGGPQKGGGWWNETIMGRLIEREAALGRQLSTQEIREVGTYMMKRAKIDNLPVVPYQRQ
jgi:RHS repeat-associated protein